MTMRFRGCRSWSSLRADSRDSGDSTPEADCTADPNFWANVWSLQAVEKTAAAAASGAIATAAAIVPQSTGQPSHELKSTKNSITTENLSKMLNDIPFEGLEQPVTRQPPTLQNTLMQEKALIPSKTTEPSNRYIQSAVQCSQPLPAPPLMVSGARRAILTKSISVHSHLPSQRVVALDSPSDSPSRHRQNSLGDPVVALKSLSGQVKCASGGSTSSESNTSLRGSSSPLSPPSSSSKEIFENTRKSPTSLLMRLASFDGPPTVQERPLRSALKSNRSFECHTTLDNRSTLRRGGSQSTRTVIKSVSYDATVELDDGCTAALKFDANRNHANVANRNFISNGSSAGHQSEDNSCWALSPHSTNSLNVNNASLKGNAIVFNGTYPIDEPIDILISTEASAASPY